MRWSLGMKRRRQPSLRSKSITNQTAYFQLWAKARILMQAQESWGKVSLASVPNTKITLMVSSQHRSYKNKLKTDKLKKRTMETWRLLSEWDHKQQSWLRVEETLILDPTLKLWLITMIDQSVLNQHTLQWQSNCIVGQVRICLPRKQQEIASHQLIHQGNLQASFPKFLEFRSLHL